MRHRQEGCGGGGRRISFSWLFKRQCGRTELRPADQNTPPILVPTCRRPQHQQLPAGHRCCTRPNAARTRADCVHDGYVTCRVPKRHMHTANAASPARRLCGPSTVRTRATGAMRGDCEF